MQQSDQPINWDNLEEQLDGPNLQANLSSEISGASDQELLSIAGKIQTTMKKMDPEEQFPVEEGWERLQTALATGEVPVLSLKPNKFRRWLIAASLLAVVSTAAIMLINQKKSGTELSKNGLVQSKIEEPGVIKITLGNGEVVEMSEGRRVIKDRSGKEIHLENTQADFSKKNPEATTIVMMNTIEVPRAKTASIILPDGTKVWLNAASTLKFPSAFTSGKREVTLLGEGYFEVVHNKGKPFVLQSGSMKVQVLGTRFNADAYADHQRLTLVEGKVKVQAGADSLLLKPGEAAEFASAQQQLIRRTTDTRQYTAWKDGDIVVHQRTLKDIANMLERTFDCQFHFENASLQQLHFTLDIPKPDQLKEVLDMLSQSTTGLSFSIDGKDITVRSK